MGEIRNSFYESRRLTWAEADFPFADARAAKPWKDFGAGLVFGDGISMSVAYQRSFEESLAMADEMAGGASYVRSLFDEVSFSDGFSWLALRLLRLADSFSVSDSKVGRADYMKEHAEALLVADAYGQKMSGTLAEMLSLTEERAAGFHPLHLESLRLTADFSPQCVFQREHIDSLRLQERRQTAFFAQRSESMRLKESFLRPADIVLSNVALRDAPFDLAGFKTLVDTAPGYEPFMPYNVGEYEYQNALTRLRVEAGVYGSEPVVYDAVINVDIEDTVDRGTVVITDTTKPTRVRFNKHYYTKPEVSVTLQGGNTSAGVVTPNICVIEADGTGFYFDVELAKSDGTRAKGRITWSAVGY